MPWKAPVSSAAEEETEQDGTPLSDSSLTSDPETGDKERSEAPKKKKTTKQKTLGQKLNVDQELLTAPFPLKRKGKSPASKSAAEAAKNQTKKTKATSKSAGGAKARVSKKNQGNASLKKKVKEKIKGDGLQIIRQLLSCVNQVVAFYHHRRGEKPKLALPDKTKS